MDLSSMLAFRNMRQKPVRTAALIALSALLSLCLSGGSVVVKSLRNGLLSLEKRLGADIVAVPYEARTKGSFESILLQGIPGTFYMDEKYYRKIAETEGVETAAPQFFLASASAGCCSVPVQVVGFDPEKDFTIKPWIRESWQGELKDGDIIVGSRINVPPDRTLRFYDTECRIAAQLDETGTGLDTAVFTRMDTIRTMMRRSKELGFHYFDQVDPDHAVSAVMVKVAEGYDVREVAGDINIHVRHVEAEPAAGLVNGITEGLRGISGVIGILTAFLWIMSLLILVIVHAMITRERARELAVLRISGASRRRIFRILLTESALTGFFGAASGTMISIFLVYAFRGLLGNLLSLPYLMPGAGEMVLLSGISIFLTTACGAFAGAYAARNVTKRDTDLILREDC